MCFPWGVVGGITWVLLMFICMGIPLFISLGNPTGIPRGVPRRLPIWDTRLYYQGNDPWNIPWDIQWDVQLDEPWDIPWDSPWDGPWDGRWDIPFAVPKPVIVEAQLDVPAPLPIAWQADGIYGIYVKYEASYTHPSMATSYAV